METIKSTGEIIGGRGRCAHLGLFGISISGYSEHIKKKKKSAAIMSYKKSNLPGPLYWKDKSEEWKILSRIFCNVIEKILEKIYRNFEKM